MDSADLKEKYFEAVQTIHNLKKQINSLHDKLKKLSTRSRWPENVKAAVQSKEMSSNQKVLEARLMELTNQCSAYEKEIYKMRANNQAKVEEPYQQILPARAEEKNTVIKDERSETAEIKISTLQTSLQRSKQVCAEIEASYKQQLKEATMRLQQAEDRLAQNLRLRNMDSSELIRMSRALKVKTAENTSLQDATHNSKAFADAAKVKLDKIMNQLSQEQQISSGLKEELCQAQLAQQSLCDVTLELEEIKKECNMLRGHLKAALAENSKCVSTVSPKEHPDTLLKFQQDAWTHQKLAAEFEEQLKSEIRCREQLEGCLKEATAENNELKKKLKDAKNHQVVSNTQNLIEEKKQLVHQGVQTLNLNMDFKPPDVSCALSGEESDKVLANMYAELERNQGLLRNQTHITKLYKEELASLHDQVQQERAQFASDLATLMSKVQDMQDHKCVQGGASLQNDQEDVVTHQCAKMTEKPTPAPRTCKFSFYDETDVKTLPAPRRNKIPCADKSLVKTSQDNFKGLEMKIHRLNASEDSPLLDDGTFVKLFIEYGLKGLTEESFETPGNFSRPANHNSPIFIEHSHHLENVCNFSHLFFNIVGEPEENNEDLAVDCIDYGNAELEIESLQERLNVDPKVEFSVPIMSEKCLIGYLTISVHSAD